jgi:hypothetical protein
MSGDLPAAVVAAIKRLTASMRESLFKKLDATAAAVSAAKLTNPFSISFNGDAAGSANTDGSTNLAITLALSDVAVGGTYNNNAAQVRPIVIDAKGRVVGFGTALAVSPLWANVQNKPTTLAGYGITDGGGAIGTVNTVFTGLMGIKLPSGATADRVNELARARYNTTTGKFEGYGQLGWVDFTNVLLASYQGSVGLVSGTTIVAFDNSAPLISEGTELWFKLVTPQLMDSVNKIAFDLVVDSGTNGRHVIISMFRNNVLIAWRSAYIVTANRPQTISMRVVDPNISLDVIDYSCRIGISSNGTWHVGRGATSTLGGVNRSSWSIEEVAP